VTSRGFFVLDDIVVGDVRVICSPMTHENQTLALVRISRVVSPLVEEMADSGDDNRIHLGVVLVKASVAVPVVACFFPLPSCRPIQLPRFGDP
jgi:hypothetical protein